MSRAGRPCRLEPEEVDVALQVVGVGLGRTGTHSLKLALEQLLGAPCHHMVEIFEHPEQIPLWTAAAEGHPDWDQVFKGYAATVDWPGAGFWRQIVAQYPDSVVLLSQRQSAEAWWNSADRTIFTMFNRIDIEPPDPPEMVSWFDTVRGILARNGVDPADETASKKAYEGHLAAVRAEVRPPRLVEWTTGDGWGPLCGALGVPEPDEPFPHVNTTEEFRALFGLDA
jgi:hypothetical protein